MATTVCRCGQCSVGLLKVSSENNQSILGSTFGLIALLLLLIGSEYLARTLGLRDDMLSVLEPGAGVALMLTLVWRWKGAVVVFVGYLALSLLLGEQFDVAGSLARALIALGAALAMRAVHRSGKWPNHVGEWLSFFVLGALIPSLVYAGLKITYIRYQKDSWPSFAETLQLTLAMILGILLIVAVLASVREVKQGLSLWKQGIGTSVAMFASLAAYAALLPYISTPGAPGLMLLLGLPVALWIAKQPNNLPGATITLIGAFLLFAYLVRQIGTLDHPQVTQTLLYFFVLVVIAQLFHALEQDRLETLAEVTRSRDALEDMVILRNSEMARMIRQSSSDTAARKRFRQTMTEKVAEPLKSMAASLSRAIGETDDDGQKERLARIEEQLDELATNVRQIANDPEFTND
jgi:hypothetical protein